MHSKGSVGMSSKTKIFNFKRFIGLILHAAIIVNFMVGIIHGFYQIFFVLMPPGGKKEPLMGATKDVTSQRTTKRCLFATETWVAISGFAIYFAVIYRDRITKLFK